MDDKEKLFKEYLEELKAMPKSDTLMPIEDRVLVLPDSPEKQSKGGIIIPPDAQTEQTKGTVIAVGASTLRGTEILVKAGDLVAYTKYAGSDMVIHGVTLRVIRYADIALLYGRAETPRLYEDEADAMLEEYKNKVTLTETE